MYAYALNMHGDVVAEAEAPSAARAVFKVAQKAAIEEHVDMTFVETSDRDFGQDGVFEVWVMQSAAASAADFRNRAELATWIHVVPRPGSRLAS
ncbi:hypothetical protein [Rhizobium leguminosarum]|uniref:hypothetical protein n=1 Tax=Rhizobium leguminosarum TaxID=384 RepID=UPI0014414FAC|nr:hypothetical protein [Rhizobium leguminosarum]NKL63280.1 hypothetical protein [Rhizobium leguminosarum bv. viciae]